MYHLLKMAADCLCGPNVALYNFPVMENVYHLDSNS